MGANALRVGVRVCRGSGLVKEEAKRSTHGGGFGLGLGVKVRVRVVV